MSTGKDVEGGTENMGFALIVGESQLVTFVSYEMSELVNLTGEKDRSEYDGSQEHPAGAFQISLVDGRNGKGHKERTGQEDEGTERGELDVEYIPNVNSRTAHRGGNLSVDQMGRDQCSEKHAVRTEEGPHEDFLLGMPVLVTGS